MKRCKTVYKNCGFVLLAISMMLSFITCTVFAESNNESPEFIFEDFSGELNDTYWTVTGNSGGTNGTNIAAVDINEQNFRLYNPESDRVGLQYKLDSAVSTGKIATEFTIRMNPNTKGALSRLEFRNQQDNVFAYMRLRHGQYPELEYALDEYNSIGSRSFSYSVPMRIKVVIDYTNSTVTAYANGTAGDPVSFRSGVRNTALDNIYIYVHEEHGPMDIAIDDFNVYRVGGVDEKIANTYNNIDLGDTSNVSENLTLMTVDPDNDTTISWASDDSEVITSAGVLGTKKGTANLTATISSSGTTVTRNFVVSNYEYYFENFDGSARPSGWSGGSIDTENKALSISIGSPNAYYTLSSPINEGAIAAEFDVLKQNSGDDYMQFKLQNSSSNDIALIDTNGERVRVRDVIDNRVVYHVSNSSKIETGKWINVKLICDFSKASEQISVYINGIKTNFDVSLFNVASSNISKIVFYIPSSQTGAQFLIDNVKIYTLGGTAEETCLGSDLGFDKTNVTNNLILSGSVNNGTVAWASSNTAVITNSGVVTRPENTDVEVVLTRTVVKKGVTNKTDFRVTVPANTGTVKYMDGDFCNTSGKPTLLTANNSVKGTAKINNDTEAAVSVKIITALYNGDRFVDYALNSVTVPAGATDVVIATDAITLPADATNYSAVGVVGVNNYTVKRFLVTTLDELTPLLDTGVLQ